MTARHIVIILHDFSTGGSERIAIRLANRWAELGRRVTLLCGTEEGAARSLVSEQVLVAVCTPETRRSPWSRLLLAFRLAPLLRTIKPDIVFAPGNFHLPVLAILARLSFDVRPAFACKLSNPVDRMPGMARWMGARLLGWIARPINVLIAMSPALLAEAQAIFPGSFLVPIGEPILDDDDPLAPAGASTNGSPLVVCAGRLCAQKDFVTAVRSFARLSASLDARLVVLGEGPDKDRLRREIARLGLSDRVELAGYVADVRPILARARLFLMTSRYEGYPAVLIEAMAAGLPIVTTDCSPAIAEILVDPELGVAVRPRSASALAGAMRESLARPAVTREAARSILDGHRIGRSASTYLALFDAVSA